MGNNSSIKSPMKSGYSSRGAPTNVFSASKNKSALGIRSKSR